MQFRYSIFGESHGPAIGVVVENLPSGIPVDMDFIGREMARRQAKRRPFHYPHRGRPAGDSKRRL